MFERIHCAKLSTGRACGKPASCHRFGPFIHGYIHSISPLDALEEFLYGSGMGAMRLQITLRTVDNVAANFVTNVLALDGTDPFGDATAVNTAVKDFYDDLNAVAYGASIAQNGHEIKWYDLPGVTPNYPVGTFTFNLASAPGGAELPSEVAICASFQATRVPGFPQARRRGRIYVGPIVASYNVSGRPTSTVLTTLCTAMEDFKTAIDAIATDTTWAVWSSVDQTAVAVANGWCDDVWDTQRRRGLAQTSRTLWP